MMMMATLIPASRFRALESPTAAAATTTTAFRGNYVAPAIDTGISRG